MGYEPLATDGKPDVPVARMTKIHRVRSTKKTMVKYSFTALGTQKLVGQPK
jgi:hypothetical protein